MTRRTARLSRWATRSAGFTLMEVLLVIMIMGILTMVAIPSFSYLGANTKLKTATSNLHLALMKARSEAVKRDATVVITPTDGSWAKGWQITSNGTTLSVQEALKGVAITLGPASVTYRSSGRIDQNATPRFNIAPVSGQTNLARCISVQANGAAAVKTSACS